MTDQTSAHDPLNGYLPAGWSLTQAVDMRQRDPKGVVKAAKDSMAVQVRAMLGFHERGIPTFDIGVAWRPDQGPIIIAAYLTQTTAPTDQRNAALAAVARAIASRLGS